MPPRTIARLIDVLTLLTVLGGVYALGYVSERLIVSRDALYGEHDMGTIKNHLHPSLYTDWESQISAQKSRGERNVMQGLSVNNVRIINVKNFSDDEHDEFTVCFDAEANDQTLVGNKVQKEKKEGFREFWTFEWEKGKWTVREITQSSGWKRYIYAPIVDEVNRGLVARKKA